MKTKRLCCIILTIILLFSSHVGVAVSAKEASSEQSGTSLPVKQDTENGVEEYIEYLEKAEKEALQDLTASDKKEAFCPGTKLSYTVETAETASYEFRLSYALSGRDDLELELRIDGQFPFAEAEQLKFYGLWKNSEKQRFDGAGNEIAPEQLLCEETVVGTAMDFTGKNALPFRFSLEKGTHTLTVTVNGGTGTIEKVVLAAPEQLSAYCAPSDAEKQNASVITLEGEEADFKSSQSLIPMSDNSSALVSPHNPVSEKLNYIGGSNWSSVGDALTWCVSVEKSGYYSLAVIYRQNIELGAISYRRLQIDGKTPFAEAYDMKFKYAADWTYTEFSGKGDPYLIWLEEGEHTLSLTVTPGEMADAYAELQKVTEVMGDLYVDITMLVGDTVDTYRSYELFNQIPDYTSRMEFSVSALKQLSEKLEKLQEKNSGSMVSTIDGAAEILQKMLDQPYSAHKYKSAYYTAYTNLGALIGSLVEMPLDIDRIYLIPYGAEKPSFGASFVEKISFGVCRFLLTFSKDYDNISSVNGESSLTLWVNWGRDQAQVLTALIQEGFTHDTGVEVSVRVVNATIIQGILAGKGPDVMLHMARTEPVNLAMRGALMDLSLMEGFEEVISAFGADSTVPYQYREGTYALPDTESFDMLFVRTDILKDLELDIPTTWEEFLNVATTLQRNNLQVYMPQNLYPTMLQQHGLPLYNMEEGITLLTGAEQIRCFIEYTDWFTKYKFPKTMESFFNRFRIGSAPMGISPYTLQTQLEIAAPEIEGRWTVVPLPATVNENGERSYVSTGTGTGCSVTKLSQNPENAWKFLKWWVSAETQTSYSVNLESLLGPLGRVSTSNRSAFEQLGWNREFLPALLDQRENIVNLPQLPGGYYVSRGIEQAFWNVVEQNANPNDTMLKWGAIVDQEMRRKKAEYE